VRADLLHLQDVDRVLLGAEAEGEELVTRGVGVVEGHEGLDFLGMRLGGMTA
jgi:hypothetical protein